MKNIAVLVDSTAYVSEELLNENKNLKIVYLSTIIDNVAKKELIEITTDEYSKYLNTNYEGFPTTSQPAVGEVVEILEELKQEGYTDVIAIALSSGISGTFSSYSTASDMVDDIKLHLFDSEVSCQAEAFYVKKALQLINDNCEPEKIIEYLENMKKFSKAYFIVDDLIHLQRGGRLNGAQAIIGNLLQVKPVLHIEDKKIVPFMKIRTYKKAITKIYELFDEFYSQNKEKNINVCIIYTSGFDKTGEIEEHFKNNYPNVKLEKGLIGPVITTHLGLGAVAVGWTIF